MANVDISWIAPAIGTLGNITSFTVLRGKVTNAGTVQTCATLQAAAAADPSVGAVNVDVECVLKDTTRVQLWLLRKGEARGYGMIGKIHAGQGTWTGNNTTYSHVSNAAGYLVSEYAGHSNGTYNSNLGMSAASNPNPSYPLWNLS